MIKKKVRERGGSERSRGVFLILRRFPLNLEVMNISEEAFK